MEGKKPSKKWSPLLRGSLINRFVTLWNDDYWILYGEWLAAPRNSNIFLAEEKIVVRQTGDSLIATIIPKGFIARNNLHIVIPKEDINLKYLLGLINSRLMDFVYSYINPEKGEALAEVKKRHIEMLPIKKVEFETDEKKKHDEIIENVDLLLKFNQELKAVTLQTKIDQLQSHIDYCEQRINEIVYQLYGLTKEEITIVEGS